MPIDCPEKSAALNEDLTLALAACGALLEYAKKTQGQELAHLTGVRAERNGESLRLDAATRRNLELTETLRDELADLRQACRWPAAVGTVEPASREARTSQPASHVG